MSEMVSAYAHYNMYDFKQKSQKKKTAPVGKKGKYKAQNTTSRRMNKNRNNGTTDKLKNGVQSKFEASISIGTVNARGQKIARSPKDKTKPNTSENMKELAENQNIDDYDTDSDDDNDNDSDNDSDNGSDNDSDNDSAEDCEDCDSCGDCDLTDDISGTDGSDTNYSQWDSQSQSQSYNETQSQWDSQTESENENSSNNFSEFTQDSYDSQSLSDSQGLNTSQNLSASQNLSVNQSLSARDSSPTPLMAPNRRTAQKRRESTGNVAENDLNNNDNKPPATKQVKQQAQPQPKQQAQPQPKQNAQPQPKQNAQPQSKRSTADPLLRSAAGSVQLAVKMVTAAKSCPLPSKGAVQPGAKSCPLPPKTKNKMAAKSCPLPKKSEALKQQQQANQKENGRRSRQLPQKKTVETGTKSANGKMEIANLSGNAADKMPRQPVHLQNSIDEGKRVLHWLINPVTPETFFSDFWEKNACQVQRNRANYFSQLISFKKIDEMLIRNHLEFTTNIDITSYKNGVRETLNPDGRAMPPAVWGFYGEGCSIRILNPSTYLSGLRQVCSIMQEYFHCLVGANVYLTPPNSQGFAPHYDDIEAFVLQVEGRKRWRLYTPPKPSDVLARVSSGNFKQEEVGEPIFDAVLEPGDILYFPRGTVHQAVTEPNYHSLHITLSVYQQQAYANLMEILMPAVLQRAIKHHLSLRRGLPLNTWQHLGLAHGVQQSEERAKLISNISGLAQQYLVPSESQIDAAVDQLAKKFQHEALPPVVLPEEHVRTVFGSRSQTNARGQCLCDYELTQQTSVRLLRANILRLMAEGSSLRIYYYVDNALEYCKYELNYMEIQPEEAAAVEKLIATYPNYMKISNIPIRSAERRIEVATALWERGVLMTEKPFKTQ